jgi:hypothetical protein
MPYGVRKFEMPTLRARASWVGNRRSINAQSASIQIRESAVIDVLSHESHAPPPPPPQELQDEHAHESTDAETDRQFRTVWLSDAPLATDSDADIVDPIDAAIYEELAESARIHMKDHNFHQECNFKAFGSANTKIHSHPKGLAQVFFNNCVVKVRIGHDLDKMIAHSRIGPVQFYNIQSSGWIPSHESLLPAFLLLRWMSSMDAIQSRAVAR